MNNESVLKRLWDEAVEAAGYVDVSQEPKDVPCGEYTCRLQKLVEGTTVKNGKTYSRVKAIFDIVSGPKCGGLPLGDFFWFSPDRGDVATKMTTRRLLELASLRLERKPETMDEAKSALRDAENKLVVRLRVESYVSKKTGKAGHNIRYLTRVDDPQ